MNYSHSNNFSFNSLGSFAKNYIHKFHRPSGSKNLIVLVDDEEVIREVTSIMIESLGYRVLSFSGGSAALQYFREHSEEVDLFLLDVVMPEMDGRELFQRLRTINPDARGYYYSAYSPSWEKTPLHNDGVLGLIAKPVSLEELERKLKTALPPIGT